MSLYRAFIEENDEKLFEVTYYHKPQRWLDNTVDSTNQIMNVQNWSSEIKYLNNSHDAISDEISNMPNDKGGVYMFYIKGICLPFIENYIVYIGRCKYTDSQNIRKRAKEYFNDDRPMIKTMFKRWKEHLYYRYYHDTDNNNIDSNEVKLIRTILPPFNEVIPDRIEIQTTIPAF
jgi:hypothetical protein